MDLLSEQAAVSVRFEGWQGPNAAFYAAGDGSLHSGAPVHRPVLGVVAVKVCFSGPCGFGPAELKASCACSDKRPTDDARAVTTVVWRAF